MAGGLGGNPPAPSFRTSALRRFGLTRPGGVFVRAASIWPGRAGSGRDRTIRPGVPFRHDLVNDGAGAAVVVHVRHRDVGSRRLGHPDLAGTDGELPASCDSPRLCSWFRRAVDARAAADRQRSNGSSTIGADRRRRGLSSTRRPPDRPCPGSVRNPFGASEIWTRCRFRSTTCRGPDAAKTIGRGEQSANTGRSAIRAGRVPGMAER